MKFHKALIFCVNLIFFLDYVYGYVMSTDKMLQMCAFLRGNFSCV